MLQKDVNEEVKNIHIEYGLGGKTPYYLSTSIIFFLIFETAICTKAEIISGIENFKRAVNKYSIFVVHVLLLSRI